MPPPAPATLTATGASVLGAAVLWVGRKVYCGFRFVR